MGTRTRGTAPGSGLKASGPRTGRLRRIDVAARRLWPPLVHREAGHMQPTALVGGEDEGGEAGTLVRPLL